VKAARVLLGLALIGGVSFGAYLVVKSVGKARGPQLQSLQEGTYIPNGADPNRPKVEVGIVTSYAGVTYVDEGPLDTSYLPPSWAYTSIIKDWK
jgi:hypothetical protein